MNDLKIEHINPFIEATQETFSMMVGVEVTRESLGIKKAGDHNSDISGIVGFAGEVTGSVVLNFPFDTAARMVGKFLGTEITDPRDYEVLDAIGELTNIVAGSAKSQMVNDGFDFHIGLPTIVIGPNHQISRPRNVPTVCIQWKSDEGDFALEICLKLDN